MSTEAFVRHLTQAELDAGLDHIRRSPVTNGRLDGIVIRPATDERVTLRECDVSPNAGVHGDRWATTGQSAEMQVTLMNSRAVELVAQSPERWPLAGDQLYVDLDLSEDNLQPGMQLIIGTALFEITPKPHNGCAKFASRFGRDALAFVNSTAGKQLHLRGIYAKVIKAGAIHVGDSVRKIDAQ
jgi:hypothetical protein